MAKQLVSNELWAIIAPLFPPDPPKPKGGRPCIGNRAALTGIRFVLRTGMPWEMLPQEMGCGSGRTCWRRLRDWQAAGVWDALPLVLLDRLGLADHIDWSRASLDSGSVPAPGGAKNPGPIRRIGANRARSATLWATAAVSRWRSDIQRQTCTIRRCWRRGLTPFPLCSDHVAGRGSDPTSCMLITAMTIHAAVGC